MPATFHRLGGSAVEFRSLSHSCPLFSNSKYSKVECSTSPDLSESRLRFKYSGGRFKSPLRV